MHSAIYQGTVWHKRFAPTEHAFNYRVFMMYLDLAELNDVLAISRFWSVRRFSPARFKRADFFSTQPHGAQVPVDQSVREAVQAKLGFYPAGPVRLLTNLRYFGYLINPISCYYCFSEHAENKLTALLIEVTNTPWGEKVHYVLDLRNYEQGSDIEFNKAMHVSPFMPMDMYYRWCGKVPGNQLQYSLENYPVTGDGARKFAAGVQFTRCEISAASLNKTIARYPFMTAKVALAIYWQAMRLAIRRVPFLPHPAR